jgi:hypothetical protein
MTTQKNWYYYKIIDNKTGKTESYVKASWQIKPEDLCEIVKNKEYYYAVEITKDEYEEG